MDSTCRLCLSQNNLHNIDIFSEYAASLNVCEVLNKYLWFNIQFGDGQSNFICSDCWCKVYDFHLFYVQIYEKHSSFKLESVFINDEELNDNFFDNDELQLSDVDDVKVDVQEVAVKAERHDEVNSSEDESQSHSLSNPGESSSTTKRVRRKSLGFPMVKVERLKFDEYPHIKKERTRKAPGPRKRRTKNSSPKPIGRPRKVDTPSRAQSNATRKQSIDEENQTVREFFKMTCDLCPEASVWFITFDEANHHYKDVHKLRKGHLTCCERKFKSRALVLEHTQRHLHPEDFTCKHCGKLYWRKYDVKVHVEDVHAPDEERIYKCSKCSKSFAKEILLKRHEVFHDEKKFVCRVCGRGFPRQNILDQHFRMQHEPPKREHICDSCGKLFKTKSAMEIHRERVHTNNERIQCTLCFRYLKNKMVMSAHMRRHDEAKLNLTCEICGQPAPNYDALNEHKRVVHVLVRPHPCTMCDRTFSKPRYLREHMATHTGIDLYFCDYCPASFKCRPSFYAHRKKNHYEEYLEVVRTSSLNVPNN